MKSANSIVQREIDLRETATALAISQKEHDEQRLVIEGVNTRLTTAEETLEQKRAEVLSLTQNVAAVQTDHRNADRSAEEIGQRSQRM